MTDTNGNILGISLRASRLPSLRALLDSVAGRSVDNRGSRLSRDEAVEGPVRSVYLAHSFGQQARGLAIQAKIEAAGLEVINPFQRGEQALIDSYLAGASKGETLGTPTGELPPDICKLIVDMDIDKIDKADGVVAILQAPPSIGTIMEIFYASYIQHKPVWTLYEIDANGRGPDGRTHRHPWIKHLTTICTSEEDLVAQFANASRKGDDIGRG